MSRMIAVLKLLEFRDIHPHWTLINVSVDYAGNPILLFDEDRGPFPVGNNPGAVQEWYKSPPTAHHIVRYKNGRTDSLRIENSTNASSTSFAQPVPDGWLLADSRNGSGRIYDKHGQLLRTINIGDAINDIQATEDGLIWVSYFDEGVFGGGIGANGLVCFDASGTAIFKYAELANSEKLPPIYDCYALNVCQDRVWLSYYSEFPLVCLKDFSLIERLKPEISLNSFAIRDRTLIGVRSFGGRSITSLDLDSEAIQDFEPVDPDGTFLRDFKNRSYSFFSSENLQYYKPFTGVGRDTNLYLYTEKSLYKRP